MRDARLLGRDHPRVGAVASLAEGPAAVALSAGGSEKTYAHEDPNEDAAAFALGPHGMLALVADAHGGAAASAEAVRCVLEGPAREWLGSADPAWGDAALDRLWDVHMAVRRTCQRSDRQGSRTTLSAALVHPAAGRVRVVSIGDSHVFAAPAGRGGTPRDLAAPGHPCRPRYFLGSESLTREELAEKAVVADVPLEGLRCLVLATDGLSERNVGVADPAAAVAEASAAAADAASPLRPLQTARGLVERSQEAHRANPSGDNIAVAVLWLSQGGQHPGDALAQGQGRGDAG